MIYAYLDRTTGALAPPQRALLLAMRAWVAGARTGRCPCAEVGAALATTGADGVARDFGIAMATLDRDAAAPLRFGTRHADRVGDDEARLLALFDAARSGRGERVRRIAAGLVREDAVARLATAVGLVAMHLAQGVFEERDR